MLLQQIINGVAIGSTYALVSIGFNMVYGILGLTNFAHSSFYMLAAYIGQYLVVRLLLDISPLIAVLMTFLITIIVTALLGATMDRTSLKPIRDKSGKPIAFLISTVGVQTIINNVILIVFGSEAKYIPNLLEEYRIILGDNAIIQGTHILIILTTILVLSLLSYIVYKTKLGKAIRAISQDPVGSKVMGINTNKVITTTFFIGTAVAAIAGLIVSMYYQRVDINMGASIGLKTFASSVLGGIGSLYGGVLGGLIIGITETLFAAYISSGYRDIVAFLVLIGVLLVKPSGLMGEKVVEKV